MRGQVRQTSDNLYYFSAFSETIDRTTNSHRRQQLALLLCTQVFQFCRKKHSPHILMQILTYFRSDNFFYRFCRSFYRPVPKLHMIIFLLKLKLIDWFCSYFKMFSSIPVYHGYAYQNVRGQGMQKEMVRGGCYLYKIVAL